MSWNRGDQIVLRYWGDWGGDDLMWVSPVTVVRDDSKCIALLLAADTCGKGPAAANGTPIPRDLPFAERAGLVAGVCDRIWHTHSRLFIATPGASHAYSLFWRASDWTFQGWYIDLQAPFRRTPIGFDSEDYVLDLLVESDLSWSWKDEDEFADAIRIGRFSAHQAAGIRLEGERVIENIEAGCWPFNSGWESWTPNPGWEIPSIPEGWDRDFRGRRSTGTVRA